MEPTRCKFGLILLVLAVLPDCPRAADHGRAQGGGPSLCYTFNVSAVGPSRCVVLGKISGTPFSKYTCGSLKAEPIGRLGKKLNATEAWEHHDEPWKHLGEEFHETLRENYQNISKAFQSLVMQGSMTCQQESNGHSSASWELGFDGQVCLRFHPENRSWTELDPRCRSLMETLGRNKKVTHLLHNISHEVCQKFLAQSTVLDTKAAPASAPATAPARATPPAVSATPATTPAAARSQDMTTVIVVPIIGGIIACVIIVACICYRKRKCCFRAPESVV